MKITSKNKEEMKRMFMKGVLKKDIAIKFNVSPRIVSYHLDSEVKQKTIDRQVKYFRDLPKRVKQRIYKKRSAYVNDYIKKKYKEDEDFREKMKKQQKERYHNRK